MELITQVDVVAEEEEDDLLVARRAAADARVEAALGLIEDAQRLLDRASEALSAVRGMAVEWRRVGTLYDKVKDTWYAVEAKANRLRRERRLLLDHEPDATEAQWTKETRS